VLYIKLILFTTTATNLTIWLANMPLSITVQTTLLAWMCHALGYALRKKHFLWCWYCGKKQIECGFVLSVLLLTTINASSQWSKFVVDSLDWASWVHNILNTVMTHITVDKSTDNAKPHLICLLSHSSIRIYYVQTKRYCDNLDFTRKM